MDNASDVCLHWELFRYMYRIQLDADYNEFRSRQLSLIQPIFFTECLSVARNIQLSAVPCGIINKISAIPMFSLLLNMHQTKYPYIILL